MHFLAAVLIPLLALFSFTGNTAPTQPFPRTAQRAPQFYCFHFYQKTHFFKTSYIIQGRGSLIKEPLLRETIESTGCRITDWHYFDGENKDGMNDFDLLFDFRPCFGGRKALEKKLREIVGEELKCPVRSWKTIEAHHVGLHDDLPYSNADKPYGSPDR